MGKKKKRIKLKNGSEMSFLKKGEGFPCYTIVECFGVNHSVITDDEIKDLINLIGKTDGVSG